MLKYDPNYVTIDIIIITRATNQKLLTLYNILKQPVLISPYNYAPKL